jgi:CHAT domain-containing protein
VRVAHFQFFALALCALASIPIPALRASVQQSSVRPQPQTQSAAPTDAGAQIDELLKKAAEAVYVQGRMKDAEAAAQQALELSEKLGDKARTMRSLSSLATASFYEGRFPEALARQLADKKPLLRALNNLATILRALGRYEEALGDYNQTIALARELGDLPMVWAVTRNVGVLYMEMGDLEKAERPLKDALRIANELKEERWKSEVPAGMAKAWKPASLETLGDWEMGRQHFAAAVDYYEQAFASKPDSPAATAEILMNMAEAWEHLGESQKSVDLLQEAIKLQQSTGTEPSPVMVSDLAHSQESLGHLSEALAGQERALAMVKQSGGDPLYEWQFESRIGHVERAMGRTQAALQHYQEAIKTIELLRAGALNTESGRAFALAASHASYVETADLLVLLHRESEALETAERGRARAFLDVLAMSRNGLADGLTPDQQAREVALLGRISAIQKELWKENISAKEEQQHKTELARAEDDLETFHLEVRRTNPRFASIRYPEPISVTRIQNDLLNPNAVLIEFLLGEKRSLAWVVSKDKVAVRVLPGQKEIEEQVAAYRKALTERASALTLQPSLAEIDRRGKVLYASLFQPIEGLIPRGRTVIIVPDGVLSYLPFETLVVGSSRGPSGETRSRYLIEKFAIVYGPSASALDEIKLMNPKMPGWPKTLLAMGDPIARTYAPLARTGAEAAATRPGAAEQMLQDVAASDATATAVLHDYAERGFSLTRLPYTRDEILSISKLYPDAQRRIYLGEQAKEETVKSEKLDQYRYIHFASHGFIDETVPGRSGILFSRDANSHEDGVLQTREIMRLKLNADLVTLSACSTGLGKLVSGEGILGLTRAFFYSGARNVTVSLWNVNDSATSALMTAFYQNLNRGLPKREALRQAKLSLLHSRNTVWRHPYFWAAFVLVGEGN